MAKLEKSSGKKIKDKNMNVKFPEDDYRELQEIADKIGGSSLSGIIRILVYTQLDKVRKTGDPKSFLDVSTKKK